MPDKDFNWNQFMHSTPQDSYTRFLNDSMDASDKLDFALYINQLKSQINKSVSQINKRATISPPTLFGQQSSPETSWQNAWKNWEIRQAEKRAKDRLRVTTPVATSPYDVTKGWRESTENAARLDRLTAEELGATPEDAQRIYDDTWKSSRKALGIGTAATLGTIGMLSAAGGTFGLPIADATNGLFAVDAVKNLLSKEGVQKTYNYAKNGDYWKALGSGAWDLLDLSMLGHTAGLMGRVGKGLLKGQNLRNAYTSDLVGRLLNSQVNKTYLPTVKRIGDVEITPDMYYRQGNELINDLNKTGTVRANSEAGKKLGNNRLINLLRKDFSTPMFAQGNLWYTPGAYSDLLVTREGMSFANKSAGITSNLNQAGIRRIPHPDFPLTPQNVTAYRWDPNYGYRYVSGPRSWQSAEHTVNYTPTVVKSEPYARIAPSDGTINTAWSYQIGTDPTNSFQLIKDTEPRYYSVHFKTSGPKSLNSNQKNQLFQAVADDIPEGSRLSTWGTVSPGGLHGLRRFEGLGFKPTLETRSLGMKSSLTPEVASKYGEVVGDKVEVPVLYKPKTVEIGSKPISEAESIGMPKSMRYNYGLTDVQRKQVIADANDFANKYGYAQIEDSPEALQQIQDMYRRHNTFGRTIADPDEFYPVWHHFGEEHRKLTTNQRAEIAATKGYPYAFGMKNPQDRVFVSGNPDLLEGYGASHQPTFAVRRRISLGHDPLKWRQNAEFELGDWAREMNPNEVRQSEHGFNAQSSEVMLGTGELSAKPLISPTQLSGAFNTPVIEVKPNWLQMQGLNRKY